MHLFRESRQSVKKLARYPVAGSDSLPFATYTVSSCNRHGESATLALSPESWPLLVFPRP